MKEWNEGEDEKGQNLNNYLLPFLLF